MAMAREKPAAPRRGLLAVLMLAVLAASVAVAWLLQQRAGAKVRAGVQILQEIRAGGLGRYWPEKPQTDWRLIQHGSKVIGWRATVRGRVEPDKFACVKVLDPLRHGAAREECVLNADATAGSYVATQGPPGRQPVTEITQADNQVRVIQHDLGLVARSPAPDNYLPEGLLEPVLRLVAARRADAQFAFVLNSLPNTHGSVRFVTARIRYAGEGKGPAGQPVVRVERSIQGGGESLTWTYELDERGIVTITSERGERWVSVDEQTLRKAFKNAPQQLRRFLPKVLHER